MSQTRLNSLADLPRRPKILVLEDHPTTIQSIRQALEADCQIYIAADGPSAVSLYSEKRPDLVLLDYEMLGATAPEILSQIRESQFQQHVPVFFMAAEAEHVCDMLGRDSGNSDFILKPLEPNVLHSRARTHLLLKFHSDQLRSVTFRDGLTGVYSRAYFEEQIAIECARSKRTGTVLSLLRLDVDFFRAYNDAYGHAAGDDALCLVARALQSQLQRPGDIVARYDGEEFACLLPETDFEPATQLAKRLEQAVRARGISHTASSVAPVLTISIGLSTRRRAADGGPETLMQLAGEQLDQAKQQGRARVCGKVLYRAASA